MPLATAGSRLAAVMIDGLIFLPGVIVGGLIPFLMRPATVELHPAPSVGMILGYTLMGLYMLGFGIYQIIMLSTRGQTIGKKAMKIRVVKLDGSQPGFVHAVLLRVIVNALPSAIPIVGGIYGLVDILFVFRADRRCIHDMIAGTRVVMAEAEPAPIAVPAM